MKVVIAIDSFKGSMSSIEAGEAAAAGTRGPFHLSFTVLCAIGH